MLSFFNDIYNKLTSIIGYQSNRYPGVIFADNDGNNFDQFLKKQCMLEQLKKINNLYTHDVVNLNQYNYFDNNLDHILRVHNKPSHKRYYRSSIIKNDHIIKHKDTYTISQMDITDLVRGSVSFSGGGYNCAYHLGVLQYIFENPCLFTDTKYLGASGGAGIVGIALCYESDPQRFQILDDITDEIIRLHDANLKLSDQVEKYTEILCKYVSEDQFLRYIKDTDKCHISLTDVTYVFPTNTIKNNFGSYKEYIDTLKASACVPLLLDNKVRKINDRSYLDGGLSNNLPILDSHTIRVSCLRYPFLDAEIYPRVLSELKYSFTPPDKQYIIDMRNLGYNDTREYMHCYKKRIDYLLSRHELNKDITNILADFELNKN